MKLLDHELFHICFWESWVITNMAAITAFPSAERQICPPGGKEGSSFVYIFPVLDTSMYKPPF